MAEGLPAPFEGRFELLEAFEGGGMSTVYRARDLQLGALVALKLSHDVRGAADDRFAREAELLARLAHPAIVRHLGHGVSHEGERYLVMEWLEGATLAERLAAGKVPPREAIRLGRRVLDALALAHDHDIVHRDVKPANLFLVGGHTDAVKLLDFGLARALHEPRRLTAVHAAIGTPLYRAPEQARGCTDVDGRADIYALGCVLFECVTGRPACGLLRSGRFGPRAGARRTARASLPWRALCPGAPTALVHLIARMLVEDRDRRAHDAAALADELGAIEAALASPARSRARG